MLCIMVRIIAFFVSKILAWLYARVNKTSLICNFIWETIFPQSTFFCLQLYVTMVTENYEFPHYCFDISLELISICRSKNNEFNVYNLSEILQLKKNR
jgi:hypothetical protein